MSTLFSTAVLLYCPEHPTSKHPDHVITDVHIASETFSSEAAPMSDNLEAIPTRKDLASSSAAVSPSPRTPPRRRHREPANCRTVVSEQTGCPRTPLTRQQVAPCISRYPQRSSSEQLARGQELALSNVSDLHQVRIPGFGGRQLIHLVHEQLFSTLLQSPTFAAAPLASPSLSVLPLAPASLFGSFLGRAASGGNLATSETFQVLVPRVPQTSSAVATAHSQYCLS